MKYFSTYSDDKQLLDLLGEINSKIKEAEAYAVKHNLHISCSMGYGFSGNFTTTEKSFIEDYGLPNLGETVNEYDEEMVWTWYSSTMSCM